MIVSFSTLRIGPYLFYIERFITQFKTTEKSIGHHTCFQRNEDLPLWRGPAVKKKSPFSNDCVVSWRGQIPVHALMYI